MIEANASQELVSSTLHDRISVWVTSLGLGDTICSTPTIRELKTIFPKNKIDIYSYYPEVFQYNGNVDSVYRFDEELELNGYYKRLRLEGYCKYFLTFFSSENKPAINHATTNIIDVCSLIAIGKTLPDHEKWLELPLLNGEFNPLEEIIGAKPINWKKAVVIHPSVTWPTRTWPKQRWDELTARLLALGYEVVAVGSDIPAIERRNEIEKVAMFECPEGAVDLIGKLSVHDAIALLDRSLAVITVDSGLLHMALCTDVNIVGVFTVVHPAFRMAWRGQSQWHKFAVVPPTGDCNFCTCYSPDVIVNFRECPKGNEPDCMPSVRKVLETFEMLVSGKYQPSPVLKEAPVVRSNTSVNPDVICQQAIQAKLDVYRAKEQFETVLKLYNDQVDNLCKVVALMKARILELEGARHQENANRPVCD